MLFRSCERVFGDWDPIALVTRFGSKFHRKQHIDLHARQWDEEKYLHLSTMLLNNYKQALSIIDQEMVEIRAALEVLECSKADLRSWDADEAQYFANIGKESEEDVHAIEYVMALRKYYDLR